MDVIALVLLLFGLKQIKSFRNSYKLIIEIQEQKACFWLSDSFFFFFHEKWMGIHIQKEI